MFKLKHIAYAGIAVLGLFLITSYFSNPGALQGSFSAAKAKVDLQITNVEDTEDSFGDNFSMEVTVTNSGGKDLVDSEFAGAIDLVGYADGEELELTVKPEATDLAKDDSIVFTVSFTAEEPTVFDFCVNPQDDGHVGLESNYDNNCHRYERALPDLVITDIQDTEDTLYDDFVLDVTVTNEGDADLVDADFAGAIDLIGTVDGAELDFSVTPEATDLDQGESIVFEVSFTAVEPYSFEFCVNPEDDYVGQESDHDNNCTVHHRELPDLELTHVAWNAPASSHAASDHNQHYGITIRNIGAVDAPDNRTLDVAVFLNGSEANGTLTPEEMGLEAGDSVLLSFSHELGMGTHTVVVCVDPDDGYMIPESDEENNCARSMVEIIGPDLSIKNVSTGRDLVRVELVNEGTQTVFPDHEVITRIYLDGDSTPHSEHVARGLNAGDTLSIDFEIELTSDHDVLICVDEDDEIEELDEENNCYEGIVSE